MGNEYKGISYKIKEGFKYIIWTSEYNGKKYYKIQLKQKNYDGTEFKYYENVHFKKGVEIENGTAIKILEGIENDRPNPKDQYNFIRELFISDYEIVEDPIAEYQENKNDDIEVIIDDDSLPF